MKVAVASGKGGTGKTSVTVNLALSVDIDQVLDCDVEEPNVHIFLPIKSSQKKPVELYVPMINDDKCDYCRKCADFCQFNALFVVNDTAMVFQELCHSCGGCKLVCPTKAITEIKREIGVISKGKHDKIELVYGELNVGEPLAVPVISSLKDEMLPNGNVILDCPPGTACPVVESIQGSDFCLLVTEPTPFGLHDLKITVEVVKQLKIPYGVIVNFAGIGDRGVYDYCETNKIPILIEIPYSKTIAEIYSQGIPYVKKMPEYRSKFSQLWETIKETVN